MWRENRIAIAVIAGVVALGLIAYFAVGSDENSARRVVIDFGAKLQEVSLLAPDASSTIESTYRPYVSEGLLKQWQAHPEGAPGRLTSSPWPDRIEVLSMSSQGSGYVVQGAIVLMTSEEKAKGGYVGFVPVMIQLIPEGGGWRIAAFQEQATTTNP